MHGVRRHWEPQLDEPVGGLGELSYGSYGCRAVPEPSAFGTGPRVRVPEQPVPSESDPREPPRRYHWYEREDVRRHAAQAALVAGTAAAAKLWRRTKRHSD